jgi:hypothetical protein
MAVIATLLWSATVGAQENTVRNDTVWHDTSGQEIWCNGGHLVCLDGQFHWIGYDTGPQRPWKINLYTSDNLVDWQFRSTLLRQQGDFAQFGWAGRPALLRHPGSGHFVIIFEADSPRQWPRHKVGFAVSQSLDGPYRLAHVQWADGTRSTGDQSVYQEGDQAYLLATLDRDIAGKKYMNQSLAIFELSSDFLRIEHKLFEGFDNVSGDPKRVPREHSSREAPHIIRVGETYYWFSSALVGWNSSATMYATATELTGPWSELQLLHTDPPSPDSYNTQHDFVLPVVGSQRTTYVYVGDRYSQWTGRGPGRNIFLPLEFTAGTPTLLGLTQWTIDTRTGQWHK